MTDPFQKEYGKLNWMAWKYTAGNLSSLKKCIPPIPTEHGVYLMRAPHPLGRVHGSSDIIYIGQSGGGKRGGNQGIGPGKGNPGRLFNTRGPDKKVRENIESLFPTEQFTVECYFTVKGEDPEKVEMKLLLAYLNTYYELPPANHKAVKSD